MDDNFNNQNNQPQQNNEPQQYVEPQQNSEPQQYNEPYYNQQTVQAQQYNETEKKPKGFAIASLIIGICSLVFSCCVPYIMFFTSVAGIVLGIVSIKKHESCKGMAIAGIVISSITALFSLVLSIFVFYVIATKGTEIMTNPALLSQYLNSMFHKA